MTDNKEIYGDYTRNILSIPNSNEDLDGFDNSTRSIVAFPDMRRVVRGHPIVPRLPPEMLSPIKIWFEDRALFFYEPDSPLGLKEFRVPRGLIEIYADVRDYLEFLESEVVEYCRISEDISNESSENS